MSELEEAILLELKRLDAAVKAMPSANPKPNLLPIFARLDELAGRLPKNTPPDLLHYLRKKSYEKARLFLEGRNAENSRGNCQRD